MARTGGRKNGYVRIARRNISNLKYADDTTLMAEKQEELKSVLINLKD